MKFNEEQLKRKDFLAKIKERADKLISEYNSRESYDLSKNLEQSLKEIVDFKKKYYDLYGQYWEIIIKLRWLGLPIMTELKKEILDMFKYHFAEIFNIPEFDVLAKLEEVLLGTTVLDDRDKFKKQLSQILLDNQEKLTKKKIIINNQEEHPTVANWLKNYNRILGTGKVDNIKRTQYLTNNKNIVGLTEEDKNKVRILFNLYEKLKLSSQTLEGLEDDIPIDEDYAKGTIKQGVFEPFKITEKENKLWELAKKTTEERMKGVGKEMSGESGTDKGIEELRNMLSQYNEGSLEYKAIKEEIAKLEIGGENKE